MAENEASNKVTVLKLFKDGYKHDARARTRKNNVDALVNKRNKRFSISKSEEDTWITLIILLLQLVLMRTAGTTLFIAPFYEGFFLISIPVFRDIKLIASLKIATRKLSVSVSFPLSVSMFLSTITTLASGITWY